MTLGMGVPRRRFCPANALSSARRFERDPGVGLQTRNWARSSVEIGLSVPLIARDAMIGVRNDQSVQQPD